MSEHDIRYDILTQNALRGVVRHVLQDTAAHGLPGEHHFFISFMTKAEGVRLPARLLARFPNEMTIVLQHHFERLTVNDYAFEVGLSFDGIMERIFIPFAAVKGFYDPSVEFGMQFEVDDGSETEQTQTAVQAKPQTALVEAATTETKSQSQPDNSEGGAQVLSLDRYRKK